MDSELNSNHKMVHTLDRNITDRQVPHHIQKYKACLEYTGYVEGSCS
jgi:hypothetical protein